MAVTSLSVPEEEGQPTASQIDRIQMRCRPKCVHPLHPKVLPMSRQARRRDAATVAAFAVTRLSFSVEEGQRGM